MTTVGLISETPDDSALEIPNKMSQKKRDTAKKQKHMRVDSIASSQAGLISATTPAAEEKVVVVSPRNDPVEDMIHDLYSEDNMGDYDSPAVGKEQDKKLNPVIEESHEYSVTNNIVSPQKSLKPQVSVIEELEDKEPRIDISRNAAGRDETSITPKAFNQNDFFAHALSIS